MKKIFMVCSMFVLLLALSVPTFALTESNVEKVAFYDATSNQSVAYSDLQSNVLYYAKYTSSSYPYIMVSVNNNIVSLSNNSSSNPYYFNPNDDVFYSGGQSETSNTKDKFYFIRPLLTCDGSTCPATDVNHDDICDDCGQPFTYNLRDDTTYMYNDVQLPIVPTPFVDKATYYTLYDDGSGTYTLVAADVRFWEDSGRIVVTEKGNLIYYAAAPGDDEWSQFSTQTSGNWVHEVKSSDTVSWSSHIIHDFTTGAIFMQGDVNFLPPLMEMAGQALSGEMVKIGKTLTILVACGVGCLACLVVLSLFGKRSLISLR